MSKITELKELMAKATPRPWKSAVHESYGKTYAIGAPKRCQLAKFYAQPANGGQIRIEPSEMYANGRLTVAATNALPALIVAAEALAQIAYDCDALSNCAVAERGEIRAWKAIARQARAAIAALEKP